MAKRIALDTSILDRIDAAPGTLEAIRALSARMELVIVTNRTLRDELVDIEDPARRARLLDLYEALPQEVIVGRRAVPRAATPASSADVGPRDTMVESLVALAASGAAEVVVTDDGETARRVKLRAPTSELCSFEDFVAFLRDRIAR